MIEGMMGAKAEVRNWNHYIGRWRLYTDNMEELSAFMAWYGTTTTTLTELETTIEALDVVLDRAYRAVLNKAGA
jgi:hypothetical protein